MISLLLSWQGAAIALCAGALYYGWLKWQHKAQILELKRRHNCEEPAKYPQKDAWGTDLLAARGKAMQEGKFLEQYRNDFKRLGHTFEESPRGQRTINTTDPLNFKTVLAAHDFGANSPFGKPLSGRSMTYPFLGNSVANDGPHHKVLKTALKPIFARAESADTIRILALTETFMRLLPKPGVVFDIQPFLIKLFTDVSTDFIFGANVNSMEDDSGKEFIDAYMTCLTWMRIRRQAGWTAFRYNWNKEYLSACTIVHQVVDKAIARALSDSEKGISPSRSTLIDGLAQEFKDPIDLRNQLLGLFLPGRDNYYILMGGILFHLARRPELWSSLREVALSKEARESDSYEIFRLSQFDEIRYVVFEGIRLITAAYFLREVKRDAILPRGGGPNGDKPIFVAAGTKINLHSKVQMYDPKIWGEDVEEFKPERWRTFKPPEWEWNPYGGGYRLCPAENHATIQIMYILVKLLQRYEGIENHDPVHEYIEEWKWAFESRNGVKIAFK